MTMRKRLIAAMSLLVLTLGVVAGYAQRARASVEIPFVFTAGGVCPRFCFYRMDANADCS